jgi:Fe-S-cluster containining protein
MHDQPPPELASFTHTCARDADHGARAFFQAMQQAFSTTLAAPPEARVGTLLTQAFDSFDGNVAIQCEDEAPLACHRGCATCCVLRVAATAPEVLLVARFLRAVAPPLAARGIDLIGQIRQADALTRGMDEPARVALRLRCPFIARGVCVIYKVRPLACRSHASHDVQACVDAVAGRRSEPVPISQGHLMVRALVQNALQSALRDAALPWGLYELNHALLLALDDEGSEAAWLAGEDVLAPAALHEVSADEMAQAFEALKALS